MSYFPKAPAGRDAAPSRKPSSGGAVQALRRSAILALPRLLLPAMRRLLRTLRVCATTGLLLAAASLYAAPAPEDDPLASLQSTYARSVQPGTEAEQYRELLAAIVQRVQRAYAREVDVPAFVAAASRVLEPVPEGTGEPAALFKKAVNEALRTLDAYSRYLDPVAHSNDRSESSGSFGGLGLEVEAGEGAVRIVAPMPGSPAARAGLQRGDLIVQVDQQTLRGVALPDAITRMRGEPGTPVSLTIRRAGVEQDFTVSVTREIIRRQAVRWSMEGDVLLLRVATFSAPVSAALEQAIVEASAARAPRGVVLDLRGNPGGLLREAVLTADTFLNDGEIVSLRGRTPGNQRTWRADANELLPGVPMVVLVDGRSASAAELVAAALQENGRALVMGQRSFGKGTVQSTWSLGEQKGALKLTTSVYHGPSGRTVQKAGVPPDIELVAAGTSEEAKAESARPEPDSDAQAARPPGVRVEQGRCGSAWKGEDPVLSCALGYLQAGSVEAFLGAYGR